LYEDCSSFIAEYALHEGITEILRRNVTERLMNELENVYPWIEKYLWANQEG